MSKQKKFFLFSTVADILIWIFLIVFAIIVLVPLIFMFTASFMPAKDIMSIPYPWIPKTLYIENYWQALRGNDGSFIFVRNILNSFFSSKCYFFRYNIIMFNYWIWVSKVSIQRKKFHINDDIEYNDDSI